MKSSGSITGAANKYSRNYILGVANGAVFSFVDAVSSPALVLAVFASQLGASNFLIGLLPAIMNAGWFLPQFLISHRLQQLPHQKPVYVSAAIIRIICWALVTVATFMLGGRNAPLLLVLFFSFYLIYCVAAGFAGSPFMTIVAKLFPPEQRGVFFAHRDLTGAFTGFAAGYVVTLALDLQHAAPFPFNYGTLFAITTVTLAVALGSFALVDEPAERVPDTASTLRDQFRAARRLLTARGNYRRFVLTRIVLSAADIATPFYTLYATRVLGVPEAAIGWYIALATGAGLVSNLVWSRVSAREGNRRVVIAAATAAALMPLFALMFGLMKDGAWLAGSFGLLFVLFGLARTAANIGYPSFLLDLAPARERPLYIGLMNTLLGVATFLPAVGGLILDLTSFAFVFALTLLFSVCGLWLAWGLEEPRRKVQ